MSELQTESITWKKVFSAKGVPYEVGKLAGETAESEGDGTVSVQSKHPFTIRVNWVSRLQTFAILR